MISFEEDPIKHLLTVHFGLVLDDIAGVSHPELVVLHDREHTGCIVFPDETPGGSAIRLTES
jgi:hypothetical protein